MTFLSKIFYSQTKADPVSIMTEPLSSYASDLPRLLPKDLLNLPGVEKKAASEIEDGVREILRNEIYPPRQIYFSVYS